MKVIESYPLFLSQMDMLWLQSKGHNKTLNQIYIYLVSDGGQPLSKFHY